MATFYPIISGTTAAAVDCTLRDTSICGGKITARDGLAGMMVGAVDVRCCGGMPGR